MDHKPESQVAAKSSHQDATRTPVMSILLPLLVGLVLNQQNLAPSNWQSRVADYFTGGSEINRPLYKPKTMQNYAQFLASYPRQESPPSILDMSSRHLLFNADMLTVSGHNLQYLATKSQSFLMRQSPFKSDRTPLEQMDILSQLDSFDVDKIRELRLNNSPAFDSPVSGIAPTSSRKTPKGARLETANKMNRWWTRLVNGNSYFDIPNYPLDEQPNPERITHIDSDLRNSIGDLKDQKNCGACYAFSWNSYAEWHYCKQTGNKIDFSEQHIVDCGHLARLNGCIEGYLLDVRDFSHTFGFNLEQDYPYQGKKGQCKNSLGKIKVKTVDFTRIVVDRHEWEEILNEQPILLEANLPQDIMDYKRGIHPGLNCDRRLAHGMLLVGHGRQDGLPYWLLRNSMGTNWGENGYLRLSRDAPMTQCFRTGFISKFKFHGVDDDKYYELYDSFKFKPTVQPEIKSLVNKRVFSLSIQNNDGSI